MFHQGSREAELSKFQQNLERNDDPAETAPATMLQLPARSLLLCGCACLAIVIVTSLTTVLVVVLNDDSNSTAT